ncbi:uncharacterized protein B0H64DRAFT_410513 [Chaetomium fimeti]|uniref:Uncharacterized protein n=1 Tax=Chaetomium fimeti TaxID=1854472 RepID=A0AAE0H7G5_9PEZI|nr:hypothetical protein B0H64DRAFT_410513 [Chaetomium fimeti]
MVRSVLPVALAALTLLSTPATAQDGVKDGPDVLDECVACPYLYKTFYTCARSVPGPTRTNVGECVCPPRASAGSDSGWYPYVEACQRCLPSSGASGEFWSNMGGLFWQTVNNCRGGRNVTADAEGVLCVATEKMENCMALRDASEGPSWVGYRLFGFEQNNSNETKVLNLAAFKPNSTSSSEAAPASTTASGTATGLEIVPASTTAPADAGTGTDNEAPATTTTDSSLAAARLSQGSPAGYVLGGLVVAGIVGLL